MTKFTILRAAALVTSIAYVPIVSRLHAQGAATTGARRELRAAPARDMKLDGRLDEQAWSAAETGSDFTQRYPDPGRPATMRTEVRILYDAQAIYVGARMFDPHPDSIAAPLARRDPGDVTSDWIDVIFDSYNDRRTGYRFGVNPVGTKLDVYHFDDSDDDTSWDAFWDVATRIDSLGWTAEYRIPLSQLRFHGSPGEQTWGLNFYRAVARRDEWTFWSPYTPSMPGFVSAFGILRGITGIQPPSAMEVTPYFSSNVATQRVAPGDPFSSRKEIAGAAGVDFRLGLGSALSLTGTVNPDFGQVEVDPAIINLSAVETFLPEKRPFFLEGSGIFQFGNLPVFAPLIFSHFIHWRRIGREPQLSPDAPYTESPEQTTILGAAKLSGQLAGGWSVGLTDAVTQREHARFVGSAGNRGTQIAEPLTNYLVARAKRAINDGRTTFGLLTTATNRSQDAGTAERLRDAGYLVGIDASTATPSRAWTLGGFFVKSLVTGSESAIAATQRSSAHYFQRPDRDTDRFDPTLTSLRGHDAAIGVVYRGKPWSASMQARETSPGYESNDLGYLSRADVRTLTASFGGERNNSEKFLRSLSATAYSQNAWDFGGNLLYQRTVLTTYEQLSSFWNLSAGGGFKPALYSNQHTRGGPLVKVPPAWETFGSISTDSRRMIIGSMYANFENKHANGNRLTTGTTLRIRPSSAIDLSVSPTLNVLKDGAQYVRTVPDAMSTATYGSRYVFATLRQRTLSVDGRADWTLTPALSFQLFAQPFVSTARFSGYKELRTPGTFDFDVYGRDRGTRTQNADGTIGIDPDGSGPVLPFTLGTRSNETSFVSRALRVNAVVRWEYRGGSALYLVWQQSRDGDGPLDDTYQEGLQRVLDAPARNVLLVKATYRLGR